MQHDIDEVIYESHILIVKKDYQQAKVRLEGLLEEGNHLSTSQKLNVLNKLLEISFIQKEYEQANVFGHQLYELVINRDNYKKVKDRLYYRLCKSDNWKSGRHFFSDICKNSN
jgi:hypothetical protein